MQFELKQIRGSSDGSYYYEVEGTFPVTFAEFYKWILNNSRDCYKVEFRIKNECYGGAWNNVLELENRNTEKQWHITKNYTENFCEKFADKEVISCTAGGGWGTMSYVCTLKEETEPTETTEENNMNNITDLYNELADSLDDFKKLLTKPSTRSAEVARHLLAMSATLVKSIEFNRRGRADCIPESLQDNEDVVQRKISEWLDSLEEPVYSAPKRYIKKFEIQENEIKRIGARLIYRTVLPVFEEGEAPTGFTPEGSCFLYDDYSSLLKPGDVFHEIVLVEVEEPYRRKGIGTQLVRDFFEECNPTSVVLRAGITKEALYNQLCEEDREVGYVYENIVPFYESLGFTDVNHTVFYFEETVPMLWPKSKADEAKRKSEEFKKKLEQECGSSKTNVFG